MKRTRTITVPESYRALPGTHPKPIGHDAASRCGVPVSETGYCPHRSRPHRKTVGSSHAVNRNQVWRQRTTPGPSSFTATARAGTTGTHVRSPSSSAAALDPIRPPQHRTNHAPAGDGGTGRNPRSRRLTDGPPRRGRPSHTADQDPPRSPGAKPVPAG